MPRIITLTFIRLLTVLSVIVGGTNALAADSITQGNTRADVVNVTPPPLFAPHTPAMPATPPGLDEAARVVRDRQVVRSRPVNIDVQLLTGPGVGPATAISLPARTITLNLFDDVSFIADADQVEPAGRSVTWIGRLRGIDLSQVIIVVSGDVVSGNISMPGARYHIRYAGNGVHEVQAIDQSLFPPDEPFVPVPPVKGESDSFRLQGDTPQADDGSVIDVMVVYTATTRAAAGGTAAIQNLIDLAITETNVSYSNSGVIQRLRLVHSEEVAYTEPATNPLSTALNCITSTSDGCLDNVHALRNAYGADLVSLWLENGGGSCGIAWLMTTVSSSFAPNGFSTVARSCATGYYSFGHELGHNMGARHDVYVDSATTPYAYAHGYTYSGAASPWRTVMAYNNACADVGKSCTRIQYWSNPEITYVGAAMGNASADNQLALDNTALTVANFRVSSSGAGTLPGAPTIGTATAGNASISVSFTPGAIGSGTLANYTAACSSSNGGAGNGATGNGSPITVSGLSNGALYTCAVRTTSTVGMGPWSASSNSVTPVAIDDGFPSGGSLPPGWIQPPGSNASWVVTNDSAYAGSLSLKSGAILHGQKSDLAYTATFPAGTVSFARRVSSESGWDFLEFYIDGVKQNSWSGEVTWSVVSFPLTSGTHTLLWRYVKDEIVSSGSDAAWIDSVTLPAATPPGAPTNVNATPGPGSATISFTAPASNGGSPITSYTVTCTASGLATVTATGTSSPITVEGLIGDVVYSCSVAATNSAGTGAASAAAQVTPSFNTAIIPLLLLMVD